MREKIPLITKLVGKCTLMFYGGSAITSHFKMSTPKMFTLKKPTPIWSAVPKCLLPFGQLGQTLYFCCDTIPVHWINDGGSTAYIVVYGVKGVGF